MGNTSSADKCDKVGFKVIEVTPDSPGAKCGLTANTDFILTVNDGLLNNMVKEDIIKLVKVRFSSFSSLKVILFFSSSVFSSQESEDKPLYLEVYSSESKESRHVTLTPSRAWPGEGLLGIVIRLESYEAIVETVAAPVSDRERYARYLCGCELRLVVYSVPVVFLRNYVKAPLLF